jgi:hypothetical protein
LRRLAAAAIVVSLAAGAALAAPSQVNISGATLFSDFFRAYASTNDYIDVNHDGIKGFDLWDLRTPQQLALGDWRSPNTWWIVMYRGVGSGNGLKELVAYNRRAPGTEIGSPTDVSTINRNVFYNNGFIGDSNSANPGGAPTPIKTVDIAVMDVPTTWFVQAGSLANAQWNRLLTTDGYGKCPIKAYNASQGNALKTLVSAVDSKVVLNTNTTNPDKNTVFDNPLAWVPIAFIANPGTGLQNVTQKQLQYLYTTGRMPSGENLVAATRDAGSGTRNGAMNSIGVDPSWARGENLGAQSKDAALVSRLGPNHQASNLGGADHMEEVVRMSRLAVGYTGLMGASRAAIRAKSGQLEILNLQKTGGTVYVRPAISNILDTGNINTSWQVGGAETFATVGDPFAPTGALYTMDNQAAADYIRNIKKSIDDFVTAPADPCHNMPGEYMAQNYTLVSGLTHVPSADPTVFVPNPAFSGNVHSYILSNTLLDMPAYGSVAPAGQVPGRAQLTGGKTYSDGRTYNGTDDYYTDSSGAQLRAGTPLSLRNRLAGDFNFDGKRDITDIGPMMAALASPRTFEVGNSNNGAGYVVPEIIGDFNGDGNFDANDIRYFADGLAIVPATGKLDRSLGFYLVDAYSATGNFFNTVLATGKRYKLGDSVADIAGSGVVYPGAQPVGADGKVDAKDIDYIRHVMNGGLAADVGITYVTNGRLDWANPNDAVWMDMSCDMNGDMIIDQSDVDVVVMDILGTKYGDVNLDGVVNDLDLAIVKANQGKSGNVGWADGDVNGDGVVDAADLAAVTAAMR